MLKTAYQIGTDLALKEAGARLDSLKALASKHPRLAEILGGGVLGAGVGGPIGLAMAPERSYADSTLLGALMGTGGGLGIAASSAAGGAAQQLPTMAGSVGGLGIYKLIQKLRGLD